MGEESPDGSGTPTAADGSDMSGGYKLALLSEMEIVYYLNLMRYVVDNAVRSCCSGEVAVCCSVFQCGAVCCSVLQCVAVWGSVLQCGTVCLSMCSVSQGVVVCFSVVQCGAVWCSVLQCVAVWCTVLQCVVVCCKVL